MSVINVRVNDNVKQDVEALFNSFGMNISTAVNVFFAQCLREQAIPFQIKAVEARQPREAILARGREALREAQEQAKVNDTSDMTLDEINEIISEVRQKMREEKAAQ